MKYMGSKSRIAKHIVPIIQSYIDSSELKCYWEPFVGGANVIDKIVAKGGRYASDNNRYLIELYRNLHRLTELPAFVDKTMYDEVRAAYNSGVIDDRFDLWYVGAIGFLASYNGRFFDGGYAGIVVTKEGNTRNYYDEAKRNLIAQTPNLVGVKFACMDYDSVVFREKEGMVIYCDPPYANTKQYNTSKNFDHEAFWGWVRKMSEKNVVLVSEETAPDDFEYIWEQEVKRTVNNTKRVNKVEKLWKWKG